jgi:outer membrane murein-binding lipoprotein Lpp
MSGRNTAKMD